MTEEKLAIKYTSGLKYSIQKHVLSHNVFSLDEAHTLALEAEESDLVPTVYEILSVEHNSGAISAIID